MREVAREWVTPPRGEGGALFEGKRGKGQN